MRGVRWVFLQNIHLMSLWVKTLERKLEQSFEPDTHKDFRCFLSAEPPGLPLQQSIPEAILQNSIKISNEPAQSLRQLLFRAWNNFNQGHMDACKRPRDFRTILLGLCVFHAEVTSPLPIHALPPHLSPTSPPSPALPPSSPPPSPFRSRTHA